MSEKNRVLLFDLGGVLADLGTPAADVGLDMTNDEFWGVWLNSSSVHAFETGKLDRDVFCRRIARELGWPDAESFESRLRQWQLPLYPGVEDLVRSIPDSVRIALLSNTNELHWAQVVSSTDLFARFDHLFLSYESGHYKPMHAAFEQVTAHYGCVPGDVLFLDDSSLNIAAAIEVGFDAHRVRGVDESRAVIDRELLAGLK
jgi:putative hydrolase of the HAD superfamily